MKRLAMRSVCRSEQPPLVFEVTKKVRGPSWMSSRFVLREGLAMRRIYSIAGGMGSIGLWRASRCCARGPAGSKEGALFCVVTARLKPCPDTCVADGCGVAVHAGRGNRAADGCGVEVRTGEENPTADGMRYGSLFFTQSFSRQRTMRTRAVI